MLRTCLLTGTVFVGALHCATQPECLASMPAPLPTPWTDGNAPEGYGGASGSNDALWQGISFFLACLLVTSAVVKALWNALRRDVTTLPRLSYGRALSLVLLCGFVFVIVLTMISGARELMTPGAWRKQGWTYTLEPSASLEDPLVVRREAIEALRIALWHHAATHDGEFPGGPDELGDDRLWSIPGQTGFQFMYVPDQRPDNSGRLLAFEPQLDGDERLVLLTNGMIGTMRTPDIEHALAEVRTRD